MPSRSTRSPVLFSALAVTALALSASYGALPGTHRHADPAPTTLAEQPLDGVGGGTTVREITQDKPFSLVALTGDDLTGTSAKVRARRDDGSWGPWYDAEALESNATDNQHHGPRGTDPVFVGRTTAV